MQIEKYQQIKNKSDPNLWTIPLIWWTTLVITLIGHFSLCVCVCVCVCTWPISLHFQTMVQESMEQYCGHKLQICSHNFLIHCTNSLYYNVLIQSLFFILFFFVNFTATIYPKQGNKIFGHYILFLPPSVPGKVKLVLQVYHICRKNLVW